ncbi:MAG: HAD family hydrolase [Planctomycetota bacterium]
MYDLAVIFDMDGVLIDTYRAHFKSWLMMAETRGLTFAEPEFAPTFGRTSREIIRMLWGDGRFSDEQMRQMDEEKEAAFRQLIAADFPGMPGVTELLRSLFDAHFKLGVGSSGPPENVCMVLERLRARPLFASVVTGRDVSRGKPDPEVFLIAAQRLGVPPMRCVVIEDAPVGVQAAKAAGMAAIGMASTGRTREELRQADLVVDSPKELSPRRIAAVIASCRRGCC